MPAPRTHVVLVPGFAGFDALGQLEYYADVTPLFRAWAGGAGRAAIHYFGDLPTASVATRAKRLRGWLAKRIARGELAHGERVALVGHSTGGLDIRQLVWELAQRPDEVLPVDGASGAAYTVLARDVLERVERIAFLSVPQWGTNLADWVRDHGAARRALVVELSAAVHGTELPGAERLEAWLAARGASTTRAELFLAVRDALAEMNARAAADPSARADALQARSEVELWLRYVASDFAAIDDLAVTPHGDGATPARFDAARRALETKAWDDHHIVTRSYATVGRRPLALPHGTPAPPLRVLDPSAWRELGAADGAGTDALYRLAWRACAGGPFALPGGGATAAATPFGGGGTQEIEVWDNDGVVNTASMLWPEGAATRLVAADHADVIGHFRLRDAVRPSARRFHTYDLLGSASGFGPDAFEALWRDVFEFCAG